MTWLDPPATDAAVHVCARPNPMPEDAGRRWQCPTCTAVYVVRVDAGTPGWSLVTPGTPTVSL